MVKTDIPVEYGELVESRNIKGIGNNMHYTLTLFTIKCIRYTQMHLENF